MDVIWCFMKQKSQLIDCSLVGMRTVNTLTSVFHHHAYVIHQVTFAIIVITVFFSSTIVVGSSSSNGWVANLVFIQLIREHTGW